MIDPNWRFWSPSGALLCGGPWTWHVIDWDQRRHFSVTGSKETLPDDPDAIEYLKRYITRLGPSDYAITVSDNGELLSISSQPEDDCTLVVHYPRYSTVSESLYDIAGNNTVKRSQLMEIDRLGPCVDLVQHRYKNPTDLRASHKRVVFKYYIIWQHRVRVWNALHIVHSLPPHPCIVPPDRIVLDEVESRVVGFTTLFVPGGDLQENTTRVFRFSWLQQLTSVVDVLNLRYGIAHQDISPRNLVIDPYTDTIQLFDFDRSGRIGDDLSGYIPERNDVAGVIFTIYEIITQDYHYRDVPFSEQDLHAVENLPEWPVAEHVRIEGNVSRYRNFLNEWATARRSPENLIHHYSEAEEAIHWPAIPAPTPVPFVSWRDKETGEAHYSSGVRTRTHAKENNEYWVNWERPPQKIANGYGDVSTEILANGKKTKNSSGPYTGRSIYQ